MLRSTINKCIENAENAAQCLCLTASSVFSSRRCGIHLGKNAGNSLEFIDHREYQPKDDIRRIDWRAVARGQKPTIKIFKEEIAPQLDIFIDGSASMATQSSNKEASLLALVSMLRIAAINSGYSVVCWLIKNTCEKIEPASASPLYWQNLQLDGTSNIGEVFTRFQPKLRGNGMRIFISDLFYDFEASRFLSQFSATAALTAVIQLVSQNDICPDLSGNLCLVDAETAKGVEVFADESLINEYKKNFYAHQNYWKNCCIAAGTFFSMCLADDFLKNYLPAELVKSGFLSMRG